MRHSLSTLLVLMLALAAPASLVGCGDDDSGDKADAGGGAGSGEAGAGEAGSGGNAGGGAGNGGTACDLSGDGKDKETIPSPTGDLTLTADKVWQLEDITYVADGDTLTIEPCTRIEGLPLSGSKAAGTLVVSRGGKLIAEGEKDEPILFTSSLPEGSREAGTWGGVVLLGKAQNFKGEDTLIEGLADAPENKHGGSNDGDNSGKLAYLRIEFGGYELSEGNEINGLTLGSVGNGTSVHHIMVNTTLDDCFEFFGGTVDADHLVCNNGGDDMFDADQGYKGTLSNLFGRQIASSSSDPNGFEMDSDAASTDEPRTNVTAKDVTLCGTGETGSETARGMVLRENLTGAFDGILVTGFDVGVDTRDGFGTPADPSVTIANSKLWDQNVADVGKDEPDMPGDDNPNNDMGFDENDWFEMGDGNEIPDPAPFTVADCQADGGPSDEVTGSDLGAFKGEADWLDGLWIDWATE